MTTDTTDQRSVTQHRPWLALTVLLIGAFMALLDTTIVNVAVPTIQTGLGASDAAVSWVVAGYALAFGLVLIPAGWVGDQRGHRVVFVAGVALFTLSSLASGLAGNQELLVAARFAQGVGAGMMFTPVTAFIQLMFSGRDRGKAFGVMGATIGFATALGPIAGGAIIRAFGAHDGWRFVFAVNVPLGVVALVAAFVFLPAKLPRGDRSQTDWAGVLLLTASLVALVLPLIQGQQQGWPVWTLISLLVSLPLLVGFAAWERGRERSGHLPLISMHLFAQRSFAGGVTLTLVYYSAFTSIFFTLAVLWQSGLGESALATGVMLLPFAAATIVGASRSDDLAARFGRGVLATGLGLVAAGLIALWLILLLAPVEDLSGWHLFAPLLVAGLGSGLFIPPNIDFIVAEVPGSEAGSASGIIGTAQRIGSAIGIAMVSATLFGTLDMTGHGTEAVGAAFVRSASHAMALSAALSVLAFLLVFTLPRKTVGWGG